MKVIVIALRLMRVRGGTYFGAPVLEFSTFLKETENGTIHIHASCTRPYRFIPVLLGLKGGKTGVKFTSISSSPVFATPYFKLPFWNFRRCWRQPKL